MIGISVIICCYNSSERLAQTLKHLAAQIVSPDLPWEIILVNNASTDKTVHVAQKEWRKHFTNPVEFRIVDQPLPGLSLARQKGFEEAKYEYVLFCDDDNWLCESYIETAFNIMKSDIQIGVLGGFGIYEPELPANPEVAPHSGFYVNGSQTWAETDHWVYGAGAIYRKSIYAYLKNKGWTQIISGRIGTRLISGEDVEICFMFCLLGYRIVADDRLKFLHSVPLKRQNLTYILDISFWLSYSYALLHSYVVIINNDQRPVQNIYTDWFKCTAKTTLKQLVDLLICKIKPGKNLTLQKKINLQNNLGVLYSIIRNINKIKRHHAHVKTLLKIKTEELAIHIRIPQSNSR